MERVACCLFFHHPPPPCARVWYVWWCFACSHSPQPHDMELSLAKASPQLSTLLWANLHSYSSSGSGTMQAVCCVPHMLCAQVLNKATTLHFEFNSSSSSSGDAAVPADALGRRGQVTTINVPNLDSFSESEHQILAELVRRYKVPQAHR